MAERLGRIALAVSVVVLVVLPVADLIGTAAGAGGGAVLTALGGLGGRAILTTLFIGACVTVGAVGVGAAAALATERAVVPGRGWLRVGMLLPLLIPGFVTALSWIGAYGPGGLASDLFGAQLPGLYGLPGIVWVLIVETVPITYLVIAAALATRIEPDAERAARASGAGRLAVAGSITMPLLAPALGAAAVLAFVSAVNAFGVPAILGTPARVITVTVRIYQDLALSADPAAFVRVAVLASALVLLAIVTVSAADTLFSTGRAVRTGAPAGAPDRGGRGRLIAAVLWAYIALTTLIPLAALVGASLTRAVGLPPVPANWTLANFAAALRGEIPLALGRSVLLAGVSAIVVVSLGALLLSVRRGRLGRALSVAVALPFAVPGSALAVAMLLTYGAPLRDTLLLIGIAYVAKFWALGHRSLVGAADAVARAPLLAARVSGASGLVALRSVVLPLMRPALAGALLAVFILALHELTMSSLLHGPGSATLAVVVLNFQELGDVATTSALGVLLTGVAVLIGGAFLLVTRRSR